MEIRLSLMNRCPYCWKAPQVDNRPELTYDVWSIECCGTRITYGSYESAVRLWNEKTTSIAAGWVA